MFVSLTTSPGFLPLLLREVKWVLLRLASTSADKVRKGCGSKLCHFGILSPSDAEKCANHRSLCIDCRSVLGTNPEGIKTVSGIFQEYAERLRNECGFTKFGFRVLSAP